jgi:hypothetical protein
MKLLKTTWLENWLQGQPLSIGREYHGLMGE